MAKNGGSCEFSEHIHSADHTMICKCPLPAESILKFLSDTFSREFIIHKSLQCKENVRSVKTVALIQNT